MKNNQGFHQKMKPRQIMVNKKQSNKASNKNKDTFNFTEYSPESNNGKKINKPFDINKYRKVPSKISKEKNPNLNSTTKKAYNGNYSNIINSKKMKLSNLKGNKTSNLFLSSQNNNLKRNISTFLLNNKSNIGVGTNLDISKSEIQYPLNYSKNEINYLQNSYNTTNSSLDNNKEINLRISLKLGHKDNNKESVKKYNIASPSNKSNCSFGKKLRQSMKYSNNINKIKNKETYSPDIIKKSDKVKEMKSFNNNFYTKRDNTNVNTFNSCYNFYQKGNLNLRTKHEINFNNTMNRQKFKNNKINYNNKNIYILDTSDDVIDENKTKTYKYKKNSEYDQEINFQTTDRYNNDENEKEFQINNRINNKEFLAYQNDLIEEFCNSIEEYMLWIVKNNFDTFIFKLREYSKEKYYNFLLLKRLQTKNIKKKFYQNRDSSNEGANNSYFSSNINNNNANAKKGFPFPDKNNLSKEYIKRRTIDNFNKNEFYQGISDNTYHRKSQGKINLKNYDSFYKNNYDTNEKTLK